MSLQRIVFGRISRNIIGHLDPEFIKLMNDIKDLLRYAFQTDNELTFPLSAPGSAGMETCFVNLIEPEDKIIENIEKKLREYNAS